MPRPGFVLEVDRSTPRVLFWRAAGFATETLPSGSRVVYPPEPMVPLSSARGAARAAIEDPAGSEPLRDRLRPGMRLTIAFDDITTPVPAMSRPDIRQHAIEAVLDVAAECGIDDVALVAARGLNRRMTDAELRCLLGDRVYDAFAHSEMLTQHDGEDVNNLSSVGDVGDVPVELNKRVVDSDLLVYVGVAGDIDGDGYQKIVGGLGAARTSRERRRLPAADTAAIIAETLDTFHIEAVLDNDVFPRNLAFIQRREPEWTIRDRVTFMATQWSSEILPSRIVDSVMRSWASPRAPIGVYAGKIEDVHSLVEARVREQTTTHLDAQSDVVTLGVPYVTRFSVNSIVNPMLMAHAALESVFGSTKRDPLVRDGGVVIVHHPARPKFHPSHQPSYIDFFEQVLGEPDEQPMMAKFEEQFATDPWYCHLYRSGYAHHGLHPFMTWGACRAALDHLGAAIVVGGDTPTVRQLGFKAASTFEDALEMARDVTGVANPSVTHLHGPPVPSVELV